MVLVALFGYIPFVVCLFALLAPRRAVIYSFLVAWLFLPMSHIVLHGYTDYNKMSAAAFGVLLASMIFDTGAIMSFRPSVWDVPMFVWCVCPFLSSYFNGLGVYDGIVSIAYQTTAWGLPYFIGRIYFNDLKGMRELALGIVVGGLIYVPLCWYEIRMSPQLHRMVYGYYQYEFGQSKRYGGYRPMVFMQHGLAVAMWMTTTAVTAFWLWWSKTTDRVMGIPMGWAVIALVGTAAACHSVGALFLLILGMAVLTLTRWTGSSFWIIALAMLPAIYMLLRTTNTWKPDNVVSAIEGQDERSGTSLNERIVSERLLVDKALMHPLFGWAGWNRFRSRDLEGNVVGVPDQMWVIAFGQHGLIGLISMTLSLTLPMFLLAWRIPVKYWRCAGAAPAAALAVLLCLHMCDNLFNAMLNPIFILCAGALSGLNFSLQSSGASTSIGSISAAPPAQMPVGSQPATA
jgi:hypothetical protein